MMNLTRSQEKNELPEFGGSHTSTPETSAKAPLVTPPSEVHEPRPREKIR